MTEDERLAQEYLTKLQESVGSTRGARQAVGGNLHGPR